MQLLTLSFPFSLHPGDLPKLRGAVSDLVDPTRKDPDAILFHNHDNSSDQDYLRWEYPLIRYTTHKGRATMIGIGAGATAMATLLLPRLLLLDTLVVNGRPLPVSGFQLRDRRIALALHDTPQAFGLYRWMALNNDNYRAWQTLEGNEPAREQLLHRALTGHLRAQAEALVPGIDKDQIHANILRVDNRKKMIWQGKPLIGFSVVAESRYQPPVGLGVGRLTAWGFGTTLGERAYTQAIKHRKARTGREEVL